MASFSRNMWIWLRSSSYFRILLFIATPSPEILCGAHRSIVSIYFYLSWHLVYYYYYECFGFRWRMCDVGGRQRERVELLQQCFHFWISELANDSEKEPNHDAYIYSGHESTLSRSHRIFSFIRRLFVFVGRVFCFDYFRCAVMLMLQIARMKTSKIRERRANGIVGRERQIRRQQDGKDRRCNKVFYGKNNQCRDCRRTSIRFSVDCQMIFNVFITDLCVRACPGFSIDICRRCRDHHNRLRQTIAISLAGAAFPIEILSKFEIIFEKVYFVWTGMPVIKLKQQHSEMISFSSNLFRFENTKFIHLPSACSLDAFTTCDTFAIPFVPLINSETTRRHQRQNGILLKNLLMQIELPETKFTPIRRHSTVGNVRSSCVMKLVHCLCLGKLSKICIYL